MFKEGSLLIETQTQLFLEKWVNKIFKISGIKRTQEDAPVYVMVNPSLNAFADDEGRIVIFTKTFIECEKLSELLGVLCHEVGHIAGRHHIRIHQQMARSSSSMIAASAVGAVASLLSGNAELALAGVAAGATVSQRSLLHHLRGEESSADAAAVRYCDHLGIPIEGLIHFFQKIQGTSLQAISPYLQTHPDISERIVTLKKYQGKKSLISNKDELEFQKIRAKIMGLFTQNEYPKDSRVHVYTTIYRLYSQRKYAQALALLEKHQEDPGNIELMADIYFKIGKTQKSVMLYKKVRHSLKSIWFDLSYLHAITEIKNRSYYNEAFQIALSWTQRCPDVVILWRLKARLAHLLGKNQVTSLSMAEYCFRKGDLEMAKNHAKRALKGNSARTSEQAQEILKNIRISLKNKK